MALAMKDNGGPAFPLEADFWERPCSGMTMRQYYKAAVDIPWDVAMDLAIQQHGEAATTWRAVVETRANMRALEADAMLAEDMAHAERDDGRDD